MTEQTRQSDLRAGRVRIRIRFAKLGKIRWTSHRDVARMWERAFRRERLPLAFSEGFSPRPKVSFGLALSTGHESVAEYLDVELTDAGQLEISSLPDRLSGALPVGVDAMAAELIAPGTPSLQEDVVSCSWRWVVAAPEGARPLGEEEVSARVAALLASSSAVVTRSHKGIETDDDIRAGIVTLVVDGPAGPEPSAGVRLQAELACQPRAIRPSEVSAALGADLEARDVRRTHQWILRDGARREPLTAALPTAATDAPHALERAS